MQYYDSKTKIQWVYRQSSFSKDPLQQAIFSKSVESAMMQYKKCNKHMQRAIMHYKGRSN